MSLTKYISTDYIKKIFKLAGPVMLGMILQSLLGTVDMWFISQLGTNEASAASLGGSASGVIFVMSALVSAGTIALITRSFGEGDEIAVKSISGESILLSALIGIIVSLVCFSNTSKIIEVMFKTNSTTTVLTSEYLRVIFIGMFLVYLNTTMRTILHALGDTITPLYIFGASNIINIILDWLFIYGFGWGLRGAAIATVSSRTISFVIITFIIVKKIYGNSIKDFLHYTRLSIKNSSRILRIGIWDCIQQVARPLTGMLMFRIVYKAGKNAGTAAFGIGGQLFNYTFIFLVGLSVAISIMVGHSLGRKDTEEVEKLIKEGLKLACINMTIFAIPYLIVPKWIIGAFINDPEVIGIGVNYLRIIYAGLLFVIFTMIFGGVFKGAGDTLPPMIASLVANVVFKLPIAYVLSIILDYGTNGVWIAVSLSVIVEAAIISIYFRMGKWKEKVI